MTNDMQTPDEHLADKALDIDQRATHITDADLQSVRTDSDLRQTCQDIFSIRKAIAERQADLDVAGRFDQFSSRLPHASFHHISRLWIWMVGVAAMIIGAIVVVLPRYNTEPSPRSDDKMLAFTADQTLLPVTIVGQKHTVYDAQTDQEQHSFDASTLTDRPVDTIRVTIPKGETYTVKLADGTQVHMHPNSWLVFPSKFAGADREVELFGEAYFEVASDKQHPFIVRSNGYTTTALGTQFNVRAYAGQPTQVALIEGRILVGTGGHSMPVHPGEMVAMGSNGKMEVTQVDTDMYVYWKDGYFYYDNMPLIDILKSIGQHYNISVMFEDHSMEDYKIHFIAKRNKSLNDIVRQLNKLSHVNIKIADNILVVDKLQ